MKSVFINLRIWSMGRLTLLSIIQVANLAAISDGGIPRWLFVTLRFSGSLGAVPCCCWTINLVALQRIILIKFSSMSFRSQYCNTFSGFLTRPHSLQYWTSYVMAKYLVAVKTSKIPTFCRI